MDEIILYKDKRNFKRTILFLSVLLFMEIFCLVFVFLYKFDLIYKITLILFTILFLIAFIYNIVKFVITPNILLKGDENELILYFSKKKFRTIKYTKIKDIKYHEPKKSKEEDIIIKVKDNEYKITGMIDAFEVFKKLKNKINK